MDANGCVGNSDSVMVTVWPLPEPSIGYIGDTLLCVGESVTLFIDSGYSSVIWTNGQATDSIVVQASNSWQVTVEDTNSCNRLSKII